jgi:short-chain fatty acids transporter
MGLIRVVTRAGDRAARAAHLLVPDPWVLAILLAVAVLAVALFIGERTPGELATVFAFGFQQPDLLAFGFQMVLVLLCGNAIAKAPLVERGIARLAALPSSSGGAAALVAFASMAMALFNWGLGLVGGALLAREVGRGFRRRGLPLNYPAVGAAAYAGMAVWHGGFSGSAPLKVASDGPFGAAIPVTDTLLAPLNLIVTGAVVAAFTLLFFAFGQGQAPEGAEAAAAPPPAEDGVRAPEAPAVGAERLERSRLVLALVALPLLLALLRHFGDKGARGVTLDVVILVFLVAGMALHARPAAYARAFADGARDSVGILLQFPLYFGVIALARDRGVVELVARGFQELAAALSPAVSPTTTAPLVTFFSAAVINLMVPSGGAQWVVQSPIVLEMAEALSLERAPLVLAFSFGDQATNLLQPFWALPLLSLTGLRARDLLGYTMVALAVQTLIVVVALVALA